MKQQILIAIALAMTATATFANNAGGCGDGDCATGTDGTGPERVSAGRQEIGGVISATGVNNPANGSISGRIEVFDSSLSGQTDPNTGEVINGTAK